VRNVPSIPGGEVGALAVLAGLVGLDAALGILLALLKGQFVWTKLGQFLGTNVLKYLGGGIVAAVLSALPSGAQGALQAGYYVAVTLAAIQFVLGDLKAKVEAMVAVFASWQQHQA
jgi:hypothetical protein